MSKGAAVAAIWIGILVTVDYNIYDGTYADQAFRMLRQIGFGY
jgi:hypothetical protein